RLAILTCLSSIFGLLVCSGCSESIATGQVASPTVAVPAEFAELADAIGSDEPLSDAAQTPTDVKEAPDPPGMESVVIGKIDAGDFAAIDPSEATFILSELPAESHAEDDPDHVDNCPFCQRKLANAPKAIVRILDGESPAKISVADLFGFSEGDVVMVSGNARFDEATGAVLIDASKVHRVR
ncbi:MAG: hypothetical protein AAF664_06760, partial [Planctomycetota bacterium]